MSDPAATQKAHVGALFDRIAADYDVAGPGCFAHFGRRLAEVVEVGRGQRVLDVATGRGAVLFPAAERVGPLGKVSGIDLAAEMVRLTSVEAAHRGVTAQIGVMDAEQLDFPDATFDRVLCGFGVMFLPNLARALGEFRRVLVPGGRVGLSTWRVSQGDDLAAVLVQLGLMKPGEVQALRFNEPEQLERPLVAAGFSGVRVLVDQAEFHYADVEQYWQDSRGTGLRHWLDALDAAQTARARAALAERFRPHQRTDGIHLTAVALLATADR